MARSFSEQEKEKIRERLLTACRQNWTQHVLRSALPNLRQNIFQHQKRILSAISILCLKAVLMACSISFKSKFS